MIKGKYVGDEEQFKGRTAILMCGIDIVKAQFDQGKYWEVNSWITFPIEEWEINETLKQ